MIRSFMIENDTLYMRSDFEGEFGTSSMQTFAPLHMQTEISFQQTNIDGYPQDFPFLIRCQEMEYFITIFRLFNPQIISHYEKESSSSFPSDLPE